MPRSAKQIAFLRASAHGWKPTNPGVKAPNMKAAPGPSDADMDMGMDEMPVAMKVKALRSRGGWGKKGGL